MDFPIGTQFPLKGGITVEVAAEEIKGGCKGCFFYTICPSCDAPEFLGECMPAFRDDHIGIIFKKIDTQKQ